jgi:hypothetical protein
VSYAICMTVERTLGANNGSLRRVLRRRCRDKRDEEERVGDLGPGCSLQGQRIKQVTAVTHVMRLDCSASI